MTADNSNNENPKSKALGLVKFLPIVLLGVGLILFITFDLARFFSYDTLRDNRVWLTDWVAANGVWAGLVFVAIYAVAVAFSLPVGSLLTIAGGFLFGLFFGTLWVVIGATLGATMLFVAVKAGIGEALRSRMGGALKRMEEGFREDELSYMFVLRLVPLFPFWLVNLAPAFLGVRLRNFMIATFFGILPGSFVYVSVGNGLGALFESGQEPDLGIIFRPQIIVPIVGLALLALIPVVYRRFFRKQMNDES